MIEVIGVDALEGLEKFFNELPEVATKAARMAINDVASGPGLATMRQQIYDEVNFPKGYLESEDRLWLRKKANDHDLTAIVTGRDRPTSLARFAPGQIPTAPGKKGVKGVRVTVDPGKSKLLKAAWLVNLKNGNLGLAVRLKPGEQFRNKSDQGTAVRLADNVYLLYGPSVNQVFRGVADDNSGKLLTMIEDEFYRQFARLSHG